MKENRLVVHKKFILIEIIKKLYKNDLLEYFAKNWKKVNWPGIL